MFNMKQIETPNQKQTICDEILHALPNWFGIESSIKNYIQETQSMPFWAALDGDLPVGFAALKIHNRYTTEIYVMGILQEYHRQGIGKSLINCCEAYSITNGAEYLTVKTLDESAPNDDYAKTRKFYLSMGFRPLEVFPLLWDERNPCLFMGKYMKGKK